MIVQKSSFPLKCFDTYPAYSAGYWQSFQFTAVSNLTICHFFVEFPMYSNLEYLKYTYIKEVYSIDYPCYQIDGDIQGLILVLNGDIQIKTDKEDIGLDHINRRVRLPDDSNKFIIPE
jgi:hypothetical protein